MKDIICIYDANEKYVKRLTSFAIKNYGKDFIFLSFADYKMLAEYIDNNDVLGVILNQEKIKEMKELKCKKKYILVEKKEEEVCDGEIKFLYKYQNANKIIENVIESIKVKVDNAKVENTKIISFYSPYNNKSIKDRIYKACKQISRVKKSLIIDLDEFSNYRGDSGLSNIIYKFKETELNKEYIESQIVRDGNIDRLLSVKFPEDFSVITNYELSLIIDALKLASYELLLVVCDSSYGKNQYILTGSDKIILSDSGTKDNTRLDVFIRYIEEQNVIDMKKIFNLNKENEDRKGIDKIMKEIIGNV